VDKVDINTILEGEGDYCVLFFLSSLVLSSPFLSTLLPIPIPPLYPFFPIPSISMKPER